MTFPTLSIIQPWPWLILRPDVVGATARSELRVGRPLMKDVENREWATNVRGWVLLHASNSRLAKWDFQKALMFAAKRGVEHIPLREGLDYGAVVGAIRIDGCENLVRSPWFSHEFFKPKPGKRLEHWGYIIGAAVPFARPVPCSGSLKFFPLPPREAATSVGGRELWQALRTQIVAAGLAQAFGIPAEEIS